MARDGRAAGAGALRVGWTRGRVPGRDPGREPRCLQSLLLSGGRGGREGGEVPAAPAPARQRRPTPGGPTLSRAASTPRRPARPAAAGERRPRRPPEREPQRRGPLAGGRFLRRPRPERAGDFEFGPVTGGSRGRKTPLERPALPLPSVFLFFVFLLSCYLFSLNVISSMNKIQRGK